MKYRFIFSLLILSALSGCKTGAESISELSGKLFNALKSGSEKQMIKCIPGTDEMIMAYELYHPDISPDKKEREKLAVEKAVSMRLSLTLAFRNILKEAREKGIDWKTAKLLDLKYSVKDRKEGFKEAKVRVIVDSNVGKNVVVFDGMESEKRWYIVEKMNWEE
jgi:hypothetical protein